MSQDFLLLFFFCFMRHATLALWLNWKKKIETRKLKIKKKCKSE